MRVLPFDRAVHASEIHNRRVQAALEAERILRAAAQHSGAAELLRNDISDQPAGSSPVHSVTSTGPPSAGTPVRIESIWRLPCVRESHLLIRLIDGPSL